jgi:hypothetical protein
MIGNHELSCLAVQPHLEAFADGELRGDMLRRVSLHLETCDACGAVVAGVQGIGDVLRGRQLHDADFADLAGLADGVVSRVRAEDRESWRGKLDRATDDLHWVLVGAGSVASAFLTALVVTVVMHSSVEQRADSLAAVLNTMTVQPPQLGGTTIVPASVAPASLVRGHGEEDVEFANLPEVNRAGLVTNLQPLPLGKAVNVREAQLLGNQLRGLRFSQQAERNSFTDPDARQVVWLYTATKVRGSDLDPAARRLIWLQTTPGKKAL